MYIWQFIKEAIINTLISTCLVETFIFIMSFKQFESNLHYPPNERTFFLRITGGKPIKGQNRTAKEIAPLTSNWPVISTKAKETLERTQGSSYDIDNLGHKNCQRDDRFKNGCISMESLNEQMLVDKQSELMSNLLFTDHQHGGDDVT